MNLRVEYISRVCKLSDAQSKKLHVAAKGAVIKHIARLQKQMLSALRVEFFPAGGNLVEAGVAEAELVVNAPAVEPGIRQRLFINRIDFGGAFDGQAQAFQFSSIGTMPQDVSAIEKHPFWKKSLDKILTAEQKLKYQQALKERKAFQRRATINHSLVGIDEQLLLTPEQREAMFKLMSKAMGDKQPQLVNGRMVRVNPGRQFTSIFQQIPRKALLETLTAAQLTKWNEYNSPQVRGYRFFSAPQVDAIPLDIKDVEVVPVEPKPKR